MTSFCLFVKKVDFGEMQFRGSPMLLPIRFAGNLNLKQCLQVLISDHSPFSPVFALQTEADHPHPSIQFTNNTE